MQSFILYWNELKCIILYEEKVTVTVDWKDDRNVLMYAFTCNYSTKHDTSNNHRLLTLMKYSHQEKNFLYVLTPRFTFNETGMKKGESGCVTNTVS